MWYAVDFYWQKWFTRSYSKSLFHLDKNPLFISLRPMILVVSFAIYLLFAAHLYGKSAYKTVLNSGEVSFVYSDNQITTGKLIGKTSSFFFVYSPRKDIIAIPISASLKQVNLGK